MIFCNNDARTIAIVRAMAIFRQIDIDVVITA